MKKKKFILIIAAVLVSSVAFLGASKINQLPKEETKVPVNNEVKSPVKASEIVSINPDAAIDIALRHAGVSRENAVMFATPSLDEEKGNAHYDIEFGYDGFEYDYEVSIGDGAVLKSKKEAEKPIENSEQNTSAPNTKKTVSKPSNPPTSKKTNSGYISIEIAKQKALEDASIKAENATFLKAYYDYDDIVPHFDIRFVAGDLEYEYEIRAADGSILEKDVDREKESANVNTNPENYISPEKAKEIAFSHAKVQAGNVKFSKAELDRDDMVVHYDVEFIEGMYEYEYEINAETGKVIAFDKDFND